MWEWVYIVVPSAVIAYFLIYSDDLFALINWAGQVIH